MRIAMVGVRGIPAHVGGAERVVEELSRELSSRGHEVLVYCRRDYVRDTAEPAYARRIITPGLGGKHIETLTHTATAMADLLRRNVDVVHIHSPGPALLIWAPVLAGIPTVLTVHAPDWRRQKWSWLARVALRLGLKVGMRLADEVTAVSRDLTEELSSRLARPVRFIPNAVRLRARAPADRLAKWGLGPDGYVLNVGRIVPEKRLELLLRAWGMLASPLPLVVVGDYVGTAYGRACRRRSPDGVVWTGARGGEDLASLYSHAALVVLPSSLEGMSLVLLEAAACGRCVVAANIPANRDVMASSILYFNKEDATDLSEVTRRALGDEGLRRSMGQKAQAAVRALPAWRNASHEMEAVYLEAIRNKRGLG